MMLRTPFFIIFGLVLAIVWTIDYFAYTKPVSINVKHINKNLLNSIKNIFIFILGIVGILLISYSLGNPSQTVGIQKQNLFVKDIYFVVDVSQSMLANDFKPNRLEVAKQKIKDFIKLRPTDRIGIVVFSDNVFTLMPLTTDNDLVLKSVDDISVGFLGSGTNIGDALALGIGRLKNPKIKNKFIVLLTDGVSNSGILTPLQAAKMAKKFNIKIYSIGIGKVKNGQYLGNGGRGRRNIPGGSVDLETMKKISSETNGQFFYAGNENSLQKIFSEIQKLESSKIEATSNTIYKSVYFKYLLFGSILFLFAEFLRRFWKKEAF